VVKYSELKRKLGNPDFLRAGDVKDGDIIILLDSGVFRDKSETPFNRAVYQFQVKLPDGSVKTWTANKTSMDQLASAYGDDLEQWIGKKVKINIVKQNVRGQFKDVNLYTHKVYKA
jgi:hypothetical protein